MVGEFAEGNIAAWVRESRENGKHRTEVTEVTEGGLDGWRIC
jgi:hypothetical protein